MEIDDPFHDGQPNSCSLIFFRGCGPFKRHEDGLKVPRIDSYAVVLDIELVTL